MVSMGASNLFGALLVFAFVRYGIPISESENIIADRVRNFAVFAVYLAFAGVVSLTAAAVMLRSVVRWQLRGGPPTRSEQMAALHAPLRQAIVHLGLWILGGVLFVFLTAEEMPSLAAAVAITVAMAATSTFGFTYMLGERILRPVAAQALSEGRFDRTMAPGVGTRLAMTWGLGTLMPVAGIVLLCVTQLTSDMEFSSDSLSWAILALSIMAIGLALVLSMLTSAQISDPVKQLRWAIERVQRGATGVQVEVFDGSEMGRLQVGFNRMMAESDERRRLRELFGQHVGEDVARRALQYGTELGGETRYVAVLFVDMVGSTATAAERPPNEVVDLLNEFFRVVVDVVDRHHGFVNKFMGDAALAIFGAPLDRPDAPTAALAAARELRFALDEITGLDIGIGVSAGLAVAGNIGAAERFEYTVIGDPVNEASRLTELAKMRPSRVLASSSALYFADDEERAQWELGDEVQLRGRRRLTHLASPIKYPE
ncbi:adenylate/guanylate cyclase domain-containing protein [Rhodococcus sp. NPDC003382]|uniref:adenylate/guanylate cyclase domain-containing protein n=1 Tax=unclassified Rhodococcus (in: high G+C Gram-positive bacteria) TaxID=192944 RepID=UPI0018CF49DF|nr:MULTISPECIES: adenylate/guanylate cyclase domain-containing protein [unclassified Rhodococcus (in: high G+C Gram-positive bacteria)]MBH0121462.1 HAMP domain-containing protein [Rhodococcus sp. CX]MCK8673657.1 HAMP domain-containing protein [Rhodococcus sp. HM1]